MKKSLIVLILACALPLREAHRFFSNEYRKGLFLLDKEIVSSPAWHVHFIVSKGFFGIVFWLWYSSIHVRFFHFRKFIWLFALFYTLDFCLYLLNHSHAGVLYFVGYLIVLVYAIIIFKKS